jgi:hypothetical protein
MWVWCLLQCFLRDFTLYEAILSLACKQLNLLVTLHEAKNALRNDMAGNAESPVLILHRLFLRLAVRVDMKFHRSFII